LLEVSRGCILSAAAVQIANLSGITFADSKVVQAIFAPAFLLMGLSHVLQPQLWVRFFEAVGRTGLAAVIIPLYTLPFALVLVVTHNVWVWDWPLFLTIAGWGMLIKSSLYLLVPGLTNRMLATNMAKSSRSYQIGGAMMALVAGVLTWQTWTAR
jgi:hypothetical protein